MPIQAAQVSRTNALPALFVSLQEITNETLAEEAVRLDDDDSKDPRNNDSVCAFHETGTAPSLINTKLQRASVSWRIAKHARIYLLCTLLI